MATCYRHPSRETGVSCSSCGRPICPDCMTSTSVGMRCPECARQRTPVRTLRNMPSATQATTVLIAVNVVAYLAELATGTGGLSGTTGSVYAHGALEAPAIHFNHEYWRLVTSGFLHAGIFHVGLNMYFLYILGRMLEPALGWVRFTVIYFVSLLTGSLGALLLNPNASTVGASGALFGLMGAAVVESRSRGINPMQSGIGGLIIFNLIFSFLFPGISIGGHIGGLIGGALAGGALLLGTRYRSALLGFAGCLVIGAVAVVASVQRADSAPLPVAVAPAAAVGAAPPSSSS